MELAETFSAMALESVPSAPSSSGGAWKPALLNKEDVMESSVFKLGEKRGEQKGEQKTIVRQYEKRLGRSLTADEHATLIARIDTLGVDRVDDVMFELSAEALALWLHNPDVK